MEYKRALNLTELLAKKSFFLLGPRATGKTFLIEQQLSEHSCVINLLRSDIYLRLSANPSLLEEMIESDQKEFIVIDEIQRIPLLLNEVHRLIEEKKYVFLLTGSSARTLKKREVNLLAGRAWEANLFALTTSEIPKFDLLRYLRFGGLPAVYNSDFPEEELFAYVSTYLKEEVQAESLVRKIPAFSRFLQLSALTSGQMLNFTSLASDTAIPASTVREYYRILEDTLIGYMLPAWTKSQKRKAISTAKFYYFDIGVRNVLAGINEIPSQSDLYGQAFEHFIINEVRAYISYRRIRKSLTYWRSKQGHEVDLLIGDDVAIEIKTASNISDKHLRGLRYLQQEGVFKRYFLVSQDKLPRQKESIEIIYWKDFLELLWADKIMHPTC